MIGDYALGRGLFAKRDFLPNELITVYGGELITTDEARVRKENRESQSRRYLMRISDSDFLVDGWQYASGIQETVGPDGVFLPKTEDATQWLQGCAPMANHDSANHNAMLAFVPLGRDEALRLLPRIPTLRAHRHIRTRRRARTLSRLPPPVSGRPTLHPVLPPPSARDPSAKSLAACVVIVQVLAKRSCSTMAPRCHLRRRPRQLLSRMRARPWMRTTKSSRWWTASL